MGNALTRRHSKHKHKNSLVHRKNFALYVHAYSCCVHVTQHTCAYAFIHTLVHSHMCIHVGMYTPSITLKSPGLVFHRCHWTVAFFYFRHVQPLFQVYDADITGYRGFVLSNTMVQVQCLYFTWFLRFSEVNTPEPIHQREGHAHSGNGIVCFPC